MSDPFILSTMKKQPENTFSRRDSLKLLGMSAIGAGALLTHCAEPEKKDEHAGHDHSATDHTLSPEDAYLLLLPFFTEHEKQTVKVLSDLVIPKDERSGSASEAGSVEFIEFMMKDDPMLVLPVQGGLHWLDHECFKRFEKNFVDCDAAQQTAMLDDIAYPETAKPEMKKGVEFFNTFRNLVLTAFFTSKMGIDDLQYMGNMPYPWDGAPQAWLDKLGVSYDA